MVNSLVNLADSGLTADSYVLLGWATCYLQREGEMEAVGVIEPVPSAYLETLMQGIPTAYRQVWGTTVEQALAIDPGQWARDQGLADRPQFCPDFEQRLLAAARTYQSRAAAAVIPVGTVRTDLNYSTDNKRILNPKNKVSRSDNVKQHKYTHQVL